MVKRFIMNLGFEMDQRINFKFGGGYYFYWFYYAGVCPPLGS